MKISIYQTHIQWTWFISFRAVRNARSYVETAFDESCSHKLENMITYVFDQ